MQVQINAVLANWTIEWLKRDGDTLGFIMSALERGWPVRISSGVIVKRKLLSIILPTQGENRNVTLFVRDEQVHQVPLSQFDWDKLVVKRGMLFYGPKHIFDIK